MKRLGKNSFDTILLISVSGERPKSQWFHHSWSIFLAVGIHRHDLQLGQASSFHAIYLRIKQEITYSLLFSECPTLCWSNVNTFSWHCFGVPRHQSAGFVWEWEWAPLVLSEGFFFLIGLFWPKSSMMSLCLAKIHLWTPVVCCIDSVLNVRGHYPHILA